MQSLDLETSCFLCHGPKIRGEQCPAYHWDDRIHRGNLKRIKDGLPPKPIEPIQPQPDGTWGPCLVCGSPTDREGRCTRENEFFHEKPYSEWMGLFHSQREAENAPPVTFLIDGFLQASAITGIAGPVRERKSLIALNVVHALVTGEKLFDRFEVVKKPERVLYLCPEVSLGPFTDRVKKIGLLDYVADKFFYRTMSSEQPLALDDADFLEAVPGSAIVLDTAIRFLEGDENSSQDVRKFADDIFSLLREGAEAVILLHHSPKEAGDNMTLENTMRGSGDFGAFLSACWGTRLQDPSNPYQSASFLSNLKQRDFESQDFELTCTPDCRLHIVGDGALQVPTLANRRNRGNKDGLEGKALEFLRSHPKLSLRDTARALKDAGILRSKDWVREMKYKQLQEAGGVLSAVSAGGE